MSTLPRPALGLDQLAALHVGEEILALGAIPMMAARTAEDFAVAVVWTCVSFMSLPPSPTADHPPRSGDETAGRSVANFCSGRHSARDDEVAEQGGKKMPLSTIMAEWITLLLIVPAILIPVALLVGFAACDQVYKLNRPPGPAILDSATGKDAVTITIEWVKGSGSQSYVLDRTDPDGITTTSIPISFSPFDDTGLQPGETYTYQIRGEDGSGQTVTTSNPLNGMTRRLVSAYAKTLTTSSDPDLQGYTMVQRIEAAHLVATGPHVRITVQASATNDASIDRLYISQAGSTGNSYDSAADLTAVWDLAVNQAAFLVPAGHTRELPLVNYQNNTVQPLLISVDFSMAPSSGVQYADVPSSEGVAYFFSQGGEAALKVRSSGYQSVSRVLFLTNIEVG